MTHYTFVSSLERGVVTVAKDEASLLAQSATEQPEQPSQSHLPLAGAGQELQADLALGG